MSDTRTDADVLRDILARSMEWQEKYYARGDGIAALERQRDDLLAANNRYLERARAAEAKLIDMSDHFRSHDRALDRIAELEAAVAAHKANQIGGCRLTSEDIFFMTQRRR